jgi:hypothetical protein
MIFARKISAPLTSLVKKIDAATVANQGHDMGSFVVFLSDDEGLADKLKVLAKTERLKECVLALDNPPGPEGYGVSRDAEVTVVLYSRATVKANFAFRKGELNDQAIAKVIGALGKILPEKK